MWLLATENFIHPRMCLLSLSLSLCLLSFSLRSPSTPYGTYTLYAGTFQPPYFYRAGEGWDASYTQVNWLHRVGPGEFVPFDEPYEYNSDTDSFNVPTVWHEYFVWNFLADRFGEEVSHQSASGASTAECDSYADCGDGANTACINGRCKLHFTFFHDAVSTALTALDYEVYEVGTCYVLFMHCFFYCDMTELSWYASLAAVAALAVSVSQSPCASFILSLSLMRTLRLVRLPCTRTYPSTRSQFGVLAGGIQRRCACSFQQIQWTSGLSLVSELLCLSPRLCSPTSNFLRF